jgi:hypothetical protein
VSPPITFYDNKYKRPLSEITRQFRPQIEPNSCYPSCITNLLQDLALMHARPEVLIHLAEVNKICEYRDWYGAKSEVVVKNLNKRIGPLGYRGHERRGATLSELLQVLNDAECSYPIIGFKQDYLIQEWGLDLGNPRNTPDHVVLLLLQNDEQMGFFDPFVGRTKKMRERNRGNGNGVVVLPAPRISSYWDDARESSWLFWVRRESSVPRNQTLIEEVMRQ